MSPVTQSSTVQFPRGTGIRVTVHGTTAQLNEGKTSESSIETNQNSTRNVGAGYFGSHMTFLTRLTSKFSKR